MHQEEHAVGMHLCVFEVDPPTGGGMEFEAGWPDTLLRS